MSHDQRCAHLIPGTIGYCRKAVSKGGMRSDLHLKSASHRASLSWRGKRENKTITEVLRRDWQFGLVSDSGAEEK